MIGHKADAAQLTADQFAANGYLTLVPDLFQGDPIPLNRPADFDLYAWLNGKQTGTAHSPKETDPIVSSVIRHMKEELGVKRIGATGYCFGAKYVIRFMDTDGGIDVGYLAHPSLVEREELLKIRGPLSIAAAGEF